MRRRSIEREGPGDHRLQMPGGEPGLDGRRAPGHSVPACSRLPRNPAADEQSLQRHRPVRVGRRLVGEAAVDEEDALLGERVAQLLDERATDGIEGRAGASAVRDAHDFGHHVGLFGGDDVLRAVFAQRCGLAAVAGECNGNRAGPVGELDGGKSHAAGSRRNQHVIADADLRHLDDGVGRQVRHPDGGGLHRRQARGRGEDTARRHDRGFGVDAVFTQAVGGDDAHRISRRVALHALAQRLDDTVGLVAHQ